MEFTATLLNQDSQLAHLKTTLEEILRSQRQTLEEKEAAEDALKRAHTKVRVSPKLTV